MKREEKFECQSHLKWMLDRIDAAIVEEQTKNDYFRYYLGASGVGEDCERKSWYDFRHAKFNEWQAYNVKAIEEGFRSEDVMIDRFKNAGFQLQHEHTNPEGKLVQYGFKDLGGWFRGHRDGKLWNIEGIGNAIWEAKATESWLDLNKAIIDHGEHNALEKWKPVYYTQAQLYMGYDGVQDHILTACNPGSTRYAIVHTKFNEHHFKNTKRKAERIITSDEPPDREYSNEDFYKCKYMCNSHTICWKGYLPKPNCRNCAHVTFHTDSEDLDKPRAACGLHNNDFPSISAMHQFYACHRFNPFFFEGSDLIELKENGDTVYRHKETAVIFTNGETGFSSMQMHENNKTKPWLSKEVNTLIKELDVDLILEEAIDDSEAEGD